MTTPLMLPLDLATDEPPEPELTPCDSCGDGSEDLYSTVSGEYVCGSCRDDSYHTCAHCGHLCDDGLTTTDDEIVSESCLGQWRCSYRQCGDCDKATTDYWHHGDGYLCEGCRQNYWECEGGCGDLLPDRDGQEYCDGCRRSELIHDYSYKPVLEFYGDGPVFLGVEIEITTVDMDDSAEIAANRLGNLAVLKEDGSVEDGFEIVTQPMTYEWATNNFPFGVLSDLKSSGAVATSSCGVHVHVSRDAFDGPAHIYRWFKLFYRNSDNVTRVARRVSDEWAAFGDYTRKQAKEYAKGARHGERYSAINVQNRDTFELRIFASTLVETELRAAMELADASVEYTRGITSKDIIHQGAWSWFAFSTWVRESGKYASLASEIERVS